MMLIAFAGVLLAGTVAFLGVQVWGAVQNHKAWKGVQLYRLNDDGSVTPIGGKCGK